MEHFKDCVEAQKRYEDAVEAYRKKWPDHCKNCGGWGGFYGEYDPSPAGVSLSPGHMTEFDPCPECMEEGICPRCGEKVWDWNEVAEDAQGPCSNCGWTEGEDEGLPEAPECWCECGKSELEESLFD